MSGGLESLRNPLERLSVLPSSLNWRTDPTTNSAVWDATIQYYKYDVAISSVNGGAYVFTGGEYQAGPPPVFPITCLLGGADPALDTNGYWQKLTQTGVETFVSATPTFAVVAGPPQTITVTNGVLQDVDAGSVWSATLSYVATWTAVQTVADILTFQIASNGTGGSTDIEDVAPLVGSTTHRGSASFIVSAGANPPAQIDLTLSATVAAGAQALVSLAGSLSWVRLK